MTLMIDTIKVYSMTLILTYMLSMQVKMPGIYITVINNSIEDLKVIVIYYFYTAIYVAFHVILVI